MTRARQPGHRQVDFSASRHCCASPQVAHFHSRQSPTIEVHIRKPEIPGSRHRSLSEPSRGVQPSWSSCKSFSSCQKILFILSHALHPLRSAVERSPCKPHSESRPAGRSLRRSTPFHGSSELSHFSWPPGTKNKIWKNAILLNKTAPAGSRRRQYAPRRERGGSAPSSPCRPGPPTEILSPGAA